MRAMLGVVAVLIGCGAAAAADDKYASAEGEFKVRFPKGEKVKTTQQDAGGGIKMNMFGVEKDEKAYMVMYMVLPEQVKDVPAKQLLDGGEKGAVQQSGGKLIKSKDMTFGKGKLPARDLLIEKDGAKARTWIVIAGLRVYVLVVGGKDEFATGKDATAFLESFEITK